MSSGQFYYNRPTFPAQLNMSHPLTRGLVGCWMLNEDAPNSLRAWDSSPYRHNGVVTGALGRWEGRNFVGASGDGIEIPYQVPLNITGAITVLAWFYFVTGISGILVGHDRVGGDRVYNLSPSSNKILAEVWTPYQSLSGDTTLANGTWNIAGFSDDLLDLRVWLNGAQDGIAAVTAIRPSSTENLTIGRKLSAGANFTGTIGGVLIYNRALTAVENRDLSLNPYDMFLR